MKFCPCIKGVGQVKFNPCKKRKKRGGGVNFSHGEGSGHKVSTLIQAVGGGGSTTSFTLS